MNLLLAALLAYVLSIIYVRFGRALSNRNLFASNFVVMASTTMVIITVVKSSLALSLGLVGALSIVRFRAAIKEPEELAYLFLTIAIGLGLGAGQRVTTVVGFVLICAFLVLGKLGPRKAVKENLHLVVSTDQPQSATLDRIIDILRHHCQRLNLQRLDENEDIFEVSFLIELGSVDDLHKLTVALKNYEATLKISFLDNKGIV